MITPCKPSAPPVSQSSLLANSCKMRATPKVTMMRVRSEPRNTPKLHTAPNTAVTNMAINKPNNGSGCRCLANKAAV